MKWASLAIAAALFVSASTASAATIDLDSWALNVDGTILNSLPLPASVNAGGFDFTTGLGVITIKVTGLGSHNVDSFFDIEIDQTLNGLSNEFGAVSGSAAAGQSWEIDEPGYVFGDIFANMAASTLDNTNAVPSTDPDDVSMALGWDFVLAANEEALITFRLSEIEPTSGFYLTQVDPDSEAYVYFNSTLTIREIGETVIPEPMTMVGCLLGLGAVTRYVRKRRA